MQKILYTTFVIVIASLVTASAIYLTPLKHIAVIDPVVKDITPFDFYQEYSLNPDKYIFLDVRPDRAYEEEHALGSESLPLQKLYTEHKNLPKHGKEIVLICSEGSASGVAYSYLEHYGFFNIVRIDGGIENWIKSGLPTEKSSVIDESNL
jgi:rhodanese-related sulfurtransferase